MEDVMDRVAGFFGKGKWKIYTAGALMAVTGFSSMYTVDGTERAVVTRFSDFARVEQPGLKFKMPFVEGVQRFPIGVKTINIGGNGSKEEGLETFTRDSQPIWLNMSVDYQLPTDPKKLENIYRNHPDYEQKMNRLVIDRAKAAIGQYEATVIAANRNEMTAAARDRIAKEAERLYGINVTDVKIANYTFEPSFQHEVNAAAQKKQQEQAAKNQQEIDKITAQNAKIKAEGEANAAIESARGGAESKKLAADAEAYRVAQEGKAQAASIREQADALRSNPNFVDLERARRWNGTVPSTVMGNGAIPFVNVPQPK